MSKADMIGYETSDDFYKAVIDASWIAEDLIDWAMVAAGRLSDSQELIEMGHNEEARILINQAKMIIFDKFSKNGI